MPAPDGFVIDEQRRGDTLTAPAVVEKDQRVRPPRQTMRRRPVSRQRDQIGPVFRRKVTPANHERNKNPNFDPRQPPLPRFLNESGYIYLQPLNLSAKRST